jgi:hypothetical protein
MRSTLIIVRFGPKNRLYKVLLQSGLVFCNNKLRVILVKYVPR